MFILTVWNKVEKNEDYTYRRYIEVPENQTSVICQNSDGMGGCLTVCSITAHVDPSGMSHVTVKSECEGIRCDGNLLGFDTCANFLMDEYQSIDIDFKFNGKRYKYLLWRHFE
jgi:hypothetical protein